MESNYLTVVAANSVLFPNRILTNPKRISSYGQAYTLRKYARNDGMEKNSFPPQINQTFVIKTAL